MDVHTQPREARFFSILNDNDSPSFAVRARQSSPPAIRSLFVDSASTSASPSPPLNKQSRPSLVRQDHFTRASSFSSAGSPPLLRLSSNSSMDSSPSPATPSYAYHDHNLLAFETMARQDLVGYLPSPTTITPFLDQQLLIAPPVMPDPFLAKSLPPTLNPTPTQYPNTQLPLNATFQHISTPTSSNSSVPPPVAVSATSVTPAPVKIQSKTSPETNSAPATGKKNKYPCPYAQSHNCSSTFTTSGHAARHGKKHTGEKGVHCPVCNKAFTRKDNMKQHERTHKVQGSGSNGEDSSTRRSKAAITKDAQKAKQPRQEDSTLFDRSRRSSLIRSPLSEVTSLAPPATDASMSTEASLPTNLYTDAQQMLMPIQTIPEALLPNTLYPALNLVDQTQLLPLPQLMMDKPTDFAMQGGLPIPPVMIRGYSDLDTLAQAAESFNPYYPPQSM